MNRSSLTTASGGSSTRLVVVGEVLPAIPRTAREAFTSLSDAQFEIFSTAVIIAQGEGHRFLAHCGQSGDQGIDAKLLNLFNYTVVVQPKRYAPDNAVGQPPVEGFSGVDLLSQSCLWLLRDNLALYSGCTTVHSRHQWTHPRH